MESFNLEAQNREITGKQVSQLRRKGIIPAVVYGGGSDSRNISMDFGKFTKLYDEAGDSSLIDLAVGGEKPVKVLVHDVQYDPLYDRITHVDFRQVNMKEELEAEVGLTFIGEASAVKQFGGILVQNMDSVTARCLPSDLVPEIEVDLSTLSELNDTIRVRDIAPPPGMKFMNEPDDVIAVVNEPISEEEFEKLEGEVEEKVGEVEVEGEEKPEEAPGEEEAKGAPAEVPPSVS